MKLNLFSRRILSACGFLSLLLSACGAQQERAVETSSVGSATTLPATLATPTPAEKRVVVAFAKDGDIQLWDSVTRQSHTILRSGDVTSVMMSDDGKVIAFIRRSLGFEPELMEHNSLWAVDSNGENPRELVSDAMLRQLLHPETADSVGFAEMGWITGTHRIIYSGVKFYAPGQGFTNSKDIYVVDADTVSNTVLASDIMPDTFVNAWRFVLSPDGQQIALITNTELSFININGSDWRKSVLTYPAVGAGDGVLLPNGVWTQDSRAFIFTGPMQSESMFVLNYTIWRVPVDGSPAEPLATLDNSHSSSVTFSPDGKQMGFSQGSDWFITTLPVDPGPLAIPYSFDIFYANLHWSPEGTAFVIKDQGLFQLCPDATEASQVCGDPIHLTNNNIINLIQWVDNSRFLFTSLEPGSLFLGNVNGTIIPIITWTDKDVLPGWSSYTPQ